LTQDEYIAVNMKMISDSVISTGDISKSTDRYENTPEFRAFIQQRYEMSFDRSRLVSAPNMHAKARKILGLE
jgi:hypothetical protein